MAQAGTGAPTAEFAPGDASIKTTPIEADYDIMWHQRLGKGSYGAVFRCTHKRSGDRRAVKVMEYSRNAKRARREAILQIRCHHPNVVALHDAYDNVHKGDPFTGSGVATRKIFIVLELMSGGELFDRIRAKQRFTEHDASAIMKTLATAVHHMHSLGVAHRDLKPENILLKTPDAPDSDVKLADFGFARAGPLTTPLGAGFYTSPEMIKALLQRKSSGAVKLTPDEEFVYDTSSDCWTLGVILYILLVGYPPYRSRDHANVHKDPFLQGKILRGEYSFEKAHWSKVSAEAKGVVASLMELDPIRRMNCEQLLKHPWIAGDAASPAVELMSPRILGTSTPAERDALRQALRLDIASIRGAINPPGSPVAKTPAPMQLAPPSQCATKLSIDHRRAMKAAKSSGSSPDAKVAKGPEADVDLSGKDESRPQAMEGQSADPVPSERTGSEYSTPPTSPTVTSSSGSSSR